MYYNRTLSEDFAQLISENGSMRWLFNYIRANDDIDLLVGNNGSKEFISIYRGTSRMLRILKTAKHDIVIIDGTDAYQKLVPELYGRKSVDDQWSGKLEKLHRIVAAHKRFHTYYNNKKEGYFQNLISRKYGLCGSVDDEFAIIDKEAVICYEHQKEKDSIFNAMQDPYKEIQQNISRIDASRYGKDIHEKKAIGNELDLVMLRKNGDVLLVEMKHSSNTSGIYLSPLQIGLYYELFLHLYKMCPSEFERSILEMTKQRRKLGLIHPKWQIPEKIQSIIPVLIICEFNPRSSAKQKFNEILSIVKEQKGNSFLDELKTYDLSENNGLQNLDLKGE